MKQARDDKPVKAVPKGVYEGGIEGRKSTGSKKKHLNEICTDLQGNGYPVSAGSNSTNKKVDKSTSAP